MLVLGRGRRESVFIGDEIKLTVEEISGGDGDGQRVVGATVRLGFEMPRWIPICRAELRARCQGAGGPGGAPPAPRPQPPPGRPVALSGAQVRLRLQVPQKVPVRHNGISTVVPDPESVAGAEGSSPTVVYHLTCRKDDRIVICNNITIAPLDFYRFVFNEPEA